MKAKIKITKEVDVKWLSVSAEVRYWEDATVNGVEDTDGTLIPLRKEDCWEPWINVETGVIKDWPAGTTADIHYKVCDAGAYTLTGDIGDTIKTIEGYVPSCLCPERNGYGDYIIMEVDATGKIKGWNPDLADLLESNDDN